ncbi:MFS transporter, partial [Rhodococcus opacus]|nr:MFS transporter [Rhodococcus opacus]
PEQPQPKTTNPQLNRGFARSHSSNFGLVVAAASPFRLSGAVGLIPAAGFVLLLAFGQMIVMPQARDLVPRLAAERRLGSYYGFMASLGGIGVLIGSVALGAAIDAAPDTGWGAAIPWLAAAAFPVASVLGLRIVLAKLH